MDCRVPAGWWRAQRSQARMEIGSSDTLSPEDARERAKRVLARVTMGEDPSADRTKLCTDITVAELCDRYLKEDADHKKESTRATNRVRIERQVKPLIGKKRVSEFTRADADKFMRDIATGKTAVTLPNGRVIAPGGRGTATRTTRMLGGIFTWAIEQGVREDNPLRGIKTYPDQRCERFLTLDEIGRLGDVLNEAETVGIAWEGVTSKHAPQKPENRRTKIEPDAALAIRLLMLTGYRVGEILNLEWSQVDLQQGIAFLSDSKTGKKSVVLSTLAMELLADAPRIGRYVVPGQGAGSSNDRPRADLKRPWDLARKHAQLEDVHLHDLRHTFASYGLGSGMGLPIIGKLLGHTQASTTQRYAHLDANPVRAAADAIAGTIAHAMQQRSNKMGKQSNNL